MVEKKQSDDIVGLTVVTKDGKKLGIAKDITFETRTGELIQLVLTNPTAHTKTLNLETKNGDFLIPYTSIIAIGDFIVVSEEDII
jgi:sporulation protein YlmC with PRC-barrel domain